MHGTATLQSALVKSDFWDATSTLKIVIFRTIILYDKTTTYGPAVGDENLDLVKFPLH